MKSFFVSILSAIIFLASFQNSLLLVDYQINRDFYELHCVNKDKPAMACHGKCEMKKESEKGNSPFKILKSSFEFNILPTKPLEINVEKLMVFKESKPASDYAPFFVNKGYLNILPHPPQI
ncbi:hypothetical protein [Chryseobacterium koreense]|uniref:hypothetical protein n=1 Tax=Chryseobacterium koreense TaxID=232216 RepID=UPI00065B069D|nr:hypothetical protein [Chryseobacterium koreense]MBB5332119.1 hypothetical protein [Chryseobacterium koreense]